MLGQLVACLSVLVVLTAGLTFGDDYALRMEHTAFTDDETIVVPVFLDSVDPVDSYQFDVCFEATLLELAEDPISFGSGLDDVDFSFHSIATDDESWNVDAIVDTDSNELLGAGVELYLSEFEWLEHGRTELEFCELSVEAVFVIDGEEVFPTRVDGSVEVGTPFLRGDVNGDGVVEPIIELAAWWCQWCDACEDSPEVDCAESMDWNDDGEAGNVELRSIVRWFVLDTGVAQLPGPFECGPERGEIDLGCEIRDDNCGDPTRETNAEYEWRIDSVTTQPGDVASVSLYLSSPEDLRGIQFRVCYDDETLSVSDGDLVYGEDLDEDLVWFDALSVTDGSITAAITPSFSCGTGTPDPPFPSGEDMEYFEVFFQVNEDAVGVTTLEFCDGNRTISPRLYNTLAEVVVPSLVEGEIEIEDRARFVRGDVDGNGIVQGLLDAVVLLRWFFTNGDTPGCQKASDVDDSGTVEGIVDSVALLQWTFGDGDALPAPGSSECGVDQTLDSIPCDVEGDCP